MDVLSISLLGGLLTWLLMSEVSSVVLGARYAKLDGVQAWATFLFASYLFGHLIFLLGSLLEDLYDRLRAQTLNWQIEQVACRGRVLSRRIHVCVSLVFNRGSNLAVNRAVKIKEHALATLQAKDVINAI